VTVSAPSAKPFAKVTATFASVATPPASAAVPSVVAPTAKVTCPVIAPAVFDVTVAVSVVVPPSPTDDGTASTVVAVDAISASYSA
jgi:hypothetical protein